MSETNPIAELLLAAHRSGERLASADLSPAITSEAEAYAIQDRVAAVLWREHGGRPTAWKVGANARDRIPSGAPMSPPVHLSPATLSVAALGMMIVEMELAYRFGRDLPPRDETYLLEEISDAIETIHVAIEIVDSRLSDHGAASILVKLADNQSNGAFVLGDGVKEWRKIDPHSLVGLFHINGKLHERVQVSHPMGDPLLLLPWWVAHMSTRGGVRTGDVVTTGSLNKPTPCKAGDVVVAEFAGIGRAEVLFTA